MSPEMASAALHVWFLSNMELKQLNFSTLDSPVLLCMADSNESKKVIQLVTFPSKGYKRQCTRAYLSLSLSLLDVIDSSPYIEQILLWGVKIKSFYFFNLFIFFYKGSNIDVITFIHQCMFTFFHMCTYDLCRSSLDSCFTGCKISSLNGECKMLCFYFIFHSLFFYSLNL